MGRIVSIGYKGSLTSSDLNDNFHGLIGENNVVDGFNIVPGNAYNKLSLTVTGSEPSRLRIKGVEIKETTSLINAITLPPTKAGSSTVRTYEVLCVYTHEAGIVSYIARSYTGKFNEDTECLIGNVSFPENYTTSSKVTIKQGVELAKLSDLKTLPYGSPGEKFQIDYEQGPILKYIESGGNGNHLHLRNSVDSSHANLTVNNLTVLGESTTGSQTTLDTTGEWIYINTDLPETDDPSQDAGIVINRGKQKDSVLMWDELNDKWKAGLRDQEQEIVLLNNPKLSKLGSTGTFPWESLTGVPNFLPVDESHKKNEDRMLKGTDVTIEAGDPATPMTIKVRGVVKAKLYENPSNLGKFLFSAQILSENVFGLSDYIKDWLLGSKTIQLGNSTAGANITQFLSSGSVKAYVNSSGKYMGDVDTVDGFHHDQSLLTSATPKFKNVSAELNADNKTILSSTLSGGQILVKSKKMNQLDFGFFVNESTPTFVASLKSDGRFSTQGDITSAGRIFNAVYNDYAEFFEKKPGSKAMPGDVIGKVRGQNLYTKYDPKTCSMPVGIYSDNFGHIIGGTEEEIEDNLDSFIPVALAGRVRVRCLEHVEEGQYIIAEDITEDAAGYARGTWDKSEYHKLGVALESTQTAEIPGYILVLVK